MGLPLPLITSHTFFLLEIITFITLQNLKILQPAFQFNIINGVQIDRFSWMRKTVNVSEGLLIRMG